MDNIQGAYEKFLQNILDIFEAYNETIKACNTSMERKFCQLLEFVQIKRLRPLIKSTFWFKRRSVDFGK